MEHSCTSTPSLPQPPYASASSPLQGCHEPQQPHPLTYPRGSHASGAPGCLTDQAGASLEACLLFPYLFRSWGFLPKMRLCVEFFLLQPLTSYAFA